MPRRHYGQECDDRQLIDEHRAAVRERYRHQRYQSYDGWRTQTPEEYHGHSDTPPACHWCGEAEANASDLCDDCEEQRQAEMEEVAEAQCPTP